MAKTCPITKRKFLIRNATLREQSFLLVHPGHETFSEPRKKFHDPVKTLKKFHDPVKIHTKNLVTQIYQKNISWPGEDIGKTFYDPGYTLKKIS